MQIGDLVTFKKHMVRDDIVWANQVGLVVEFSQDRMPMVLWTGENEACTEPSSFLEVVNESR